MLWLCYHHFAITGIQVPFIGLKLNCIIVITNIIMIISNISFVTSISIMVTICIAITHQTLNHYNLCHICERALLCSMNTYIYIYGDSYLERYPSWEISTICTKSALTIFLIITTNTNNNPSSFKIWCYQTYDFANIINSAKKQHKHTEDDALLRYCYCLIKAIIMIKYFFLLQFNTQYCNQFFIARTLNSTSRGFLCSICKLGLLQPF